VDEKILLNNRLIILGGWEVIGGSLLLNIIFKDKT
jgi:hypothetical protein